MLDSSKAIYATDIPVIVKKVNSIFLQNKYALISINLLVKKNFQIVWNQPISHLFSRRVYVLQKIITDQWVYYQYFLRYLRKFYKSNFSCSVTISYQSFTGVFGKVWHAEILINDAGVLERCQWQQHLERC